MSPDDTQYIVTCCTCGHKFSTPDEDARYCGKVCEDAARAGMIAEQAITKARAVSDARAYAETGHTALPPDFFNPTYFFTREGKMMYLDTMNATDIKLTHIVRRLSKMNRWRGETNIPWSVAQHSLMMLARAEEDGITDAFLLRSILSHDFAEAYVIDLPADIKQRPDMGAYRELCRQIDSLVATAYSVDPHHEVVKKYDRWAAEVEFRELIYPAGASKYCNYAPAHLGESGLIRAAERLGMKDL